MTSKQYKKVGLITILLCIILGIIGIRKCGDGSVNIQSDTKFGKVISSPLVLDTTLQIKPAPSPTPPERVKRKVIAKVQEVLPCKADTIPLVIEDTKTEYPSVVADSDTLVVRSDIPVAITPRHLPYMALKTNFVAWAMGIVNLSAEIGISDHVSLELPFVWCGWDISKQHSLRILLVQPEARWWFSSPGKGHFVGVHTHIGKYNLKWDSNRYQRTSRPLLGAGISYGYALPFSEKLGAEFTLGVGYANTKYNIYHNIKNGSCFDTKEKNLFGITKVGISLIYHFNTAQ